MLSVAQHPGTWQGSVDRAALAAYLHPSGSGWVKAWRPGDGGSPLRIDRAALVPHLTGPAAATAISLHRYGRIREGVRQLCGVAVRLPLHGRDPHTLYTAVTDTLEAATYPVPTLAVADGATLTLVWAHTPVPVRARPRWALARATLERVLAAFEPRPAPADDADIIPVPGPHARIVGPVWAPWPFEPLVHRLLPLSRPAWRAVQRAGRQRPQRAAAPRRGGASALWQRRLRALYRFIEDQHGGVLPPGFRDIPLVLMAVAWSWILGDPERVWARMQAECARWTQGAWSATTLRTALTTVLRRTAAAQAGSTGAWGPWPEDPRYRFREATFWAWLGLAQPPAGVARGGGLPRAAWLAQHTLTRTAPWAALGMSRATWYRRGRPVPPGWTVDASCPTRWIPPADGETGPRVCGESLAPESGGTSASQPTGSGPVPPTPQAETAAARTPSQPGQDRRDPGVGAANRAGAAEPAPGHRAAPWRGGMANTGGTAAPAVGGAPGEASPDDAWAARLAQCEAEWADEWLRWRMMRDLVDDRTAPDETDAGRWAEQEPTLAGRWVDSDGREVWATRTLAWAWATGAVDDIRHVATTRFQLVTPVAVTVRAARVRTQAERRRARRSGSRPSRRKRVAG